MSKKIKCSLVTSTYNWPEALELVLLSVKNQSILPGEVIIADDGSKKETALLIQKFQKDFPVPLVHIWHEDKGHRKTVIMNKAIAKTKNNYIIEVDGDIILHKDFVKDHLTFSNSQFYLFGSRVNIQKEVLEEVFTHKRIHFNLFSKGIKKRGRTIRFPILTKLEEPYPKISTKLRGCNMSFWKEDFIAVNGYNENIKGWGKEDSELIKRLHNIGIKGKRLKHSGIAYHLYHPIQNKSQLNINSAIEKETTEKNVTYIEKGVDQYLK